MNENVKALENLSHMKSIHSLAHSFIKLSHETMQSFLNKNSLQRIKEAFIYELQGLQQLMRDWSSDRYWNSDLYTMLYMNYHKTVKCLETVLLHLIKAAEANNYDSSDMKQWVAELENVIKVEGYQHQTADKVAEIMHKIPNRNDFEGHNTWISVSGA
ncbi:unnamed protein product [Nippostrongylus brasiliensis]|uniref:Ferritin n=1 Tax=Nippostrongylus brasiliensis TaxID=27835 RepID=A0A0N4YAE4_NIPBR|nr:unnamed protein product [Nippostrongylus brasiliensis]